MIYSASSDSASATNTPPTRTTSPRLGSTPVRLGASAADRPQPGSYVIPSKGLASYSKNLGRVRSASSPLPMIFSFDCGNGSGHDIQRA